MEIIKDISDIAKAEKGDIIYFGKYKQDDSTGNSKKAIVWKVLDIDINKRKALLISAKILDCIPYNKTLRDCTWETCTFRTWLNEDFYESAFTTTEKAIILSTKIINNENPENNTLNGKDTTDKIFLFSVDEAKKYFVSDLAREVQGTVYANSKELYCPEDRPPTPNRYWWLRTSGKSPSYAKVAGPDGYGDIIVNSKNFGVRPALWLTF